MEVFSTSAQAILGSAIEFGIGVAGFSGIILALVPESFRRRQPLSLRWALQVIVFSSLVIIGFSLLPFLIVEMGLEKVVWQVCSAVYVTYYPFIAYFRTRQGLTAAGELDARYRFSVKVVSVLTMGISAAWLMQIANVVFIGDAWPFLLLVVYYMVFAFSCFATFLMVIISDQEEAGDV